MARNTMLPKAKRKLVARDDNKVAISQGRCRCYREKIEHTAGTASQSGAPTGMKIAEYTCTCGYVAKQIRNEAKAKRHKAKRIEAKRQREAEQRKAAEAERRKENQARLESKATPITPAPAPVAPAPPSDNLIEELRFYQQYYNSNRISLKRGRERFKAERERDREREQAKIEKELKRSGTGRVNTKFVPIGTALEGK